MRRVVSLYLPTWPTDRWRRQLGPSAPPVETPVVLIGRSGRQRLVLAADAAAQALRIVPGLPAAQARAHAADLVIADADVQADREALDRLALWALKRYAPVIAADAPDGLVLDITGAAHRYDGEQGLLGDLLAHAAASGFNARAAVADSWGAAHAAARFLARPSFVVPNGQSAAALAPLPTRALRLPPGIVDGLSKLGIDSVGEIAAKPRAPLALRFGPELTRRLDQAFDQTAEPIEPIEAPELIAVKRVFGEPIGAPETLARYTGLLVESLCAALETEGLGARLLDLRFHRVDNRVEAIRAATARPVRDVKRLTRLLCDRLETVDPGFGVEAMSLAAPGAEPLDWRPVAPKGDWGLTGPAEADVSDLIDTLSNRLGPGRLYRLAPAQSDVPERSARKLKPAAQATAETWPKAWPRPTRLLRRPEPIEAMALLPDQPPVAFTWRGMRRRVRRADGPERIFGEWWRRDGELDAVRDYFQVEDDAGERFWIFRRGDGERAATGDLTWWLHGVFG